VINSEAGSSKLHEIIYPAVEGRRFLRNVKQFRQVTGHHIKEEASVRVASWRGNSDIGTLELVLLFSCGWSSII
jgi:hypothetical protein